MYLVLKILFDSDEVIAAKEILSILEDEYDCHIDIKTVRSIIGHINEFFYELVGGNMITTIHKRGYQVDLTFLSNAQIQFLMDAVASHDDLNNEDKKNLTDILLSFIPECKQDQLLIPTFKNGNKEFSILRNIQTLQKAIQTDKMITFNYITYDVINHRLEEVNAKNGNDTEDNSLYLVSPYKIINTNNHYYLIAYNAKYKKLVNYRVDRMRRILVKRRVRYDFPEDVDLENEINKTINMYSLSDHISTIELEVMNQSALREVVSRFGEHLHASKTYKGSYLVKVEDVQINDGLKGWLLMMGNIVKVTSPESLVTSQTEAIKQLMHLYE